MCLVISLLLFSVRWCPEPGSNRHALRRGILSMLSLGFPKAWTISLPSTLLGKAVGVQSWLLRGLNLPSSLYTFRQCIVGLARDCHFTGSPELTHSLLKHFCLRGTGFLVLPCVYQFHHPGKLVMVAGADLRLAVSLLQGDFRCA